MQAMVDEQRRLQQAKQSLEDMEKQKEGSTAEAVCERLGRRQFEEGEDLFAVQWSGIHKMAQTGDIRGLRFFLEDSNTPPNIRDDRGDTPLNTAAHAGQSAAVEELLKHGADVNAKNNKGWTPALSAASTDHRDVMMLLHHAGADLKMKDITGSTAAHMAASTNSVQSIKAIYECFGDPGVLSAQSHNGSTPAHIAAIFDNAEALKALYELGANMDKQDRSGETPAHKAAKSHHVRCVEFLQAVGADMNTTNDEVWVIGIDISM
ncbi:Ankyrin [Ectocarpus siliculosus]|uniref:Ankyrin n=1 Tax=Ectocarpus siliculosus TaxID=2880 RepID=D8LTC7_ECTSI|nr:Ankyrin [Ectocarpus siliculosus]|eukprot:CBN77998.1 Ankyrin [Ectocarpus siliculosus]